MLTSEEQSIADNIRRLMDESDPPLSVREVERRASLSTGSLQKFLSGHHSPLFKMVSAVAAVLEVSIDELKRPAKSQRKKVPA